MIRMDGRIPAPIRINGKIDKIFKTVTFKDGNTVLQQVQVTQGGTATYNGTVPAKDGNAFLGWVLSEPSNPIVDTDVFSGTIYQQIMNVQENITCWAVYENHAVIRDSWNVISQRSAAGTASDYYNVGDVKRIHIEGTVGTLAVNQDVYVYILGFDHNSEFENAGITFGCFKDVNDLTDIALVDSRYSNYNSNGMKTFNINHWGYYNSGGWSGCDIRYDILGSTDIAPTGYGTAPDSSRVGYDATSTCATNPVANTFMSCLPSDLRVVMKPIVKYTDNTGYVSGDSNMTATIDYLPLLAEYEIFGENRYASQYEHTKQIQYDYFSSGNSKVKYKHNDKSFSCDWWERSSSHSSMAQFCFVSYFTGNAEQFDTDVSRGLAPIFLV